MSFLLCHECYAWVEPDDGRCPDCQQPVDPATPDPPLEQLQAALGTVVGLLGEVSLKRRRLPRLGMLYATSEGLLFLPHRTAHEPQLIETGVGSSLFWTLAAMIWTPLILVMPFLPGRRKQPVLMPVLRPHFLPDGESERLPRLLMNDPGVFFLPRKAIRLIHRRWGRWIVERRDGPPLKFKPAADPLHFHEQLATLTATPGWQDVTIA